MLRDAKHSKRPLMGMCLVFERACLHDWAICRRRCELGLKFVVKVNSCIHELLKAVVNAGDAEESDGHVKPYKEGDQFKK